jgi:hypothetical protein
MQKAIAAHAAVLTVFKRGAAANTSIDDAVRSITFALDDLGVRS